MDHHRQARMAMGILATAVAAAALTLLLVACSSGTEESGDSVSVPDYEKALADAPPPLTKLYAQGDAVLDGGEATYEEALAGVKGYPVVVNNWASWCLPCREEFPYFQEQAAERGTDIAFLGVNSEDFPDGAETFLRDNPLPYPSVEAPDKGEFAGWIDEALVGLPNTVFYGPDGELVHVRQGPYESEADLAADIERYAQPDRSG